MRPFVVRVVSLFIGLAVAAAVLVVVASAVGDGFTRAVLLTFGAAIFGAALAVFLIQVTLGVGATGLQHQASQRDLLVNGTTVEHTQPERATL